MALSRVKTWVKEVLTFADLNAEFNNILNNPTSLISPATADWDLAANDLILDDDNDTKIGAPTDNQINITIGGTLIYTLTDTIFDFNGKRLDLNADNDTSIRASASDIITMEAQGFDAWIFDGDVALPVNGLTFTSAATGTYPNITAHGTDTNIGLDFVVKGSGNHTFTGGTGAILFNAKELVLDADLDCTITCDTDDQIDFKAQAFDFFILDGSVGTPVNGLTIAATATGTPATITAHGETNAGINLVPKAAEQVYIDGGVLAGKCFNATVAWDPGTVADADSKSQAVTVTGAVLTDFVMVSTDSTDYASTAEITLTAHMSAADEATIVIWNDSGAGFTPGSDNYYVRVLSRT